MLVMQWHDNAGMSIAAKHCRVRLVIHFVRITMNHTLKHVMQFTLLCADVCRFAVDLGDRH
jgi:hypothetical protein